MRSYQDIQYTLHRKDSDQAADIYIERDGHIAIYVPQSFDDNAVNRLIESKRYWIYKQLEQWQELNAQRRTREYVNGESFLYLGRNYRLKIVPDQPQPLLLEGEYFLLSEGALKKGPQENFKSFYREAGQELLAERIALYKDAMNVEINGVRVMELHHRWASCSADGTLNFHWKVMMAPLKVIDYLVVHELAHRKQPDHSALFWEEVKKVLLDYEDRKHWLELYGSSLDL